VDYAGACLDLAEHLEDTNDIFDAIVIKDFEESFAEDGRADLGDGGRDSLIMSSSYEGDLSGATVTLL